MDVVSIVACGPSALECGAKSAPGFVIAVNDAFQHVRHDAVLSMDGRWATHRADRWRNTFRDALWLRRRACAQIGYTVREYPSVVPFDCDNHSATFSDKLGTLNGQNSGYCALNLAYQMRPKVVYLFGYDHKGDHFHPESEWRLRGEGSRNGAGKFMTWAEDCVVARKAFDRVGVRVVNTNRDSRITAFDFGHAP